MPTPPLDFLWLEITGRCQLACEHCYASSGPSGTHGTMTTADWKRTIDQAVDLGVARIQLVGGEPTLHPDLPALVRHALCRGPEVEVYSNLVRVSDELWRLFESPGVALATSYYSPAGEQHDAVTGRRNSHDRTLASIRQALARGIPVRVGVVSVRPGQQVHAAVAELRALGVADIGVDRVRQVGRGVRDAVPDIAQLCGGCADLSLAVSPVGDAWPCVLSRWLRVGNVREEPLEAVNARAGEVRRELAAAFAERRGERRCGPDGDGGLCRPVCMPVLGCRPFRADH